MGITRWSMCLLCIITLWVAFTQATVLTPNCTCLQARFDYLLRRNDVALANKDAVFHFQLRGDIEHMTWYCSLCAVDPIFMEDSISQCEAAKARYSVDYGVSESDAFTHWSNTYISVGNTWHAEMCDGVLPPNANQPPYDQLLFPYECTCIKAREAYLNVYTDVKRAGVDPLTHYLNYGINEGRAWACPCTFGVDVYMNDTFCQTCAPAIAAISSQYSLASTTINPFLIYNTYYYPFPPNGVQFHCELCLDNATSTTTSGYGTTTGSMSTSTTTGNTPAPLSLSCTCLAAGNDYLLRYPDLLGAGVNPTSHFNLAGRMEGRTWDCTLCSYSTLKIDQSFANCSAAAQEYASDYSVTNEDPFSNFLAQMDTSMNKWHYELCPLPLPQVSDQCKCIGAYTSYYNRYPTSTGFDALYHYRWFSGALGTTWDCTLCTDSSFRPTDSVCNCPEAAALFSTSFDYSSSSAYSIAMQYSETLGAPWHCDVCSTSVADPSTSLTCNCSAARVAYLNNYPLVSGDPWVHYTTVGKYALNEWDCGICNDTCPGAYSTSVWLSDSQVSGFSSSSTVTIPTGCYYPLSASLTITTGDLYISGVLRCANPSGSFVITSKKIWVYGGLECGTYDNPFSGLLSITLSGPKPAVAQADRVGGDKSIAVFASGVVSLHGAKRVSWTRIATQANAGDWYITVQNSVDWTVGDTIVVASTSPYYLNLDIRGYYESEVRVISNISGNVIGLKSPLNYLHLAEEEQLTSTLTLEKRAEVGLLSGRNIRVQGDDANKASGFGAHIMMLHGARGYASGIQVTNGGQLAILARYPWHWHNLGDIPSGQFIRNSSVYNSANRCITVHGTNNTVVADNVCYWFVGHGYFLEDGVETGNLISSNLGIYAIRPQAGQALIASDTFNGPHAYGPAVFWLSNPNNTLIDNVAVGSYGAGFWVQPESAPTGLHIGEDYDPRLAPWGRNFNNKVHGCMQGFTSCPIQGGAEGMETPYNVWLVENLHIYGVNLGLWPCGTFQRYQGLIISEPVLGMQVPTRQYFNDVAFVDVPRTSGSPTSTNAINLYDSGWVIDTVLFKNYDTNSSHSVFRPTGAADFYSSTRTLSVTLENSPDGDYYNFTFQYYDGEWGHFVNDIDGTLTGYLNHTLVTDHPMMLNGSCFHTATSNFGYICPMRYGEMLIEFNTFGLRAATIGRYLLSSGSTNLDASAVSFPNQVFDFYRWSAIANSDYVYVFVMPTQQPNYYIQQIRMSPYSQLGDSFAIEIRNVGKAPSALVGISKAANCSAVFHNKAGQSYFIDTVNSKVCVRLVTTKFGSVIANDPWGYYSSISATVYAGTSEEDQAVVVPIGKVVPHNETCVGAITEYWRVYPDVRRANVDSVYHYQSRGYLEGRAWYGSLCATTPYWPEDDDCICADAESEYGLENPIVLGDSIYYPGVTFDPHDHFDMYRDTLGYGYHCEFCPLPNIIGPFTLSYDCTCEEAMSQYKIDYIDIPATMNSVYHYQRFGGAETRHWPCEKCTSPPAGQARAIYAYTDCNCTAAQKQYLAAYPADTTLFAADPITHWKRFGGVYDFYWDCSLCPSPILTPTASPTNTPTNSPQGSPTQPPTTNPTSSPNPAQPTETPPTTLPPTSPPVTTAYPSPAPTEPPTNIRGDAARTSGTISIMFILAVMLI